MIEAALEAVGGVGESIDVREGGVEAGAPGGEAVCGFGGSRSATLEGGESREVLDGAVHGMIRSFVYLVMGEGR